VPPAFLGILMLDTRFPRPPGDIGNPATFERAGIPAQFLVVRGASPKRVVQDADAGLLEPFIAAAQTLAGQGARMVSTTCGFLAAWQAQLAQALPVPVVTSSLLLCAQFEYPGIVTFDAPSLARNILDAAGVPQRTPVAGIAPGCELHRRILDDDSELDFREAGRNVVDAAQRLVADHPEVEDIVLECANMPPYRQAVAAATGRRVHDLETMLLGAWRTLAMAENG
jgi:hypothetical protein